MVYGVWYINIRIHKPWFLVSPLRTPDFSQAQRTWILHTRRLVRAIIFFRMPPVEPHVHPTYGPTIHNTDCCSHKSCMTQYTNTLKAMQELYHEQEDALYHGGPHSCILLHGFPVTHTHRETQRHTASAKQKETQWPFLTIFGVETSSGAGLAEASL